MTNHLPGDEILGTVDLEGEWKVAFRLDDITTYRAVLYSARVRLESLGASTGMTENPSNLTFEMLYSDFLYPRRFKLW